jgi:hypothetical protein
MYIFKGEKRKTSGHLLSPITFSLRKTSLCQVGLYTQLLSLNLLMWRKLELLALSQRGGGQSFCECI